MTESHLQNANPRRLEAQNMEFQQWTLDSAIARITALKEKAKPAGAAAEFYDTIEDCLQALRYAAQANSNYTRVFGQMCRRMEILERLVLRYLPEQELVTHRLIDDLKSEKNRIA